MLLATEAIVSGIQSSLTAVCLAPECFLLESGCHIGFWCCQHLQNVRSILGGAPSKVQSLKYSTAVLFVQQLIDISRF